MEQFDLAAHRARIAPEATALEDLASGQVYSYGALNERAARVAAAAIEHWGLQPGDRLAYLGHSSAEFFALLFGCAKAGLILVPLNWRLAVPELEGLLEDARPGALLYTADFAEPVRTLQPQFADMVAVAMEPEQTNGGAIRPRRYEADLEAVTPHLRPHPPCDPDTPWYLLYTSGTTGRPKGVIQTFRMMLANFYNIGLSIEVRQSDVLLNVLPMFHTAGINLYSTCVLLVGGTVLVAPGFDAAQALRVLEERATLFFGVPAVYQALLDQPKLDGRRLQRVRSWGCGGAPLALPVAERFVDMGIRVRTGYGMTETGPGVFLLEESQVLDRLGSVGRPLLLAEVRVVNAAGEDLPADQPGELWIRGPGVTPGYWQQPEVTRQAISEEGWLRTGDVACYDAEGYYRIVDRWKDMFISGGENIYPAEVERALETHDAVSEVAVVGVPDERWGEVGRAFIVLAETQPTPPKEALQAWCRERLAGYKVPHHIDYVDALPRNALGKITKQELRR